jgi:hypothetical protein
MNAQYFQTDFTFLPVGNHQRVGVDTAQALTAPAKASIIFIQAEVGTIRYRIDGQTATATSGLRLAPNEGERRFDLYQGVSISVIGEAAGAFVNFIWATRI